MATPKYNPQNLHYVTGRVDTAFGEGGDHLAKMAPHMFGEAPPAAPVHYGDRSGLVPAEPQAEVEGEGDAPEIHEVEGEVEGSEKETQTEPQAEVEGEGEGEGEGPTAEEEDESVPGSEESDEEGADSDADPVEQVPAGDGEA